MDNSPKLRWERFADCNDNATEAFEEMCRRLFTAEYLKGQDIPHSNANNKGVEVQPIMEPEREDGQPRKWISFQSKYTKTTSSAYQLFEKSARVTAREYEGKLDLVYLFSNQTLSTGTKSFGKIVNIHKNAGIEVLPITNTDLLDLIKKYPDIAESYFCFKDLMAESTILLTSYPGIMVQRDTGNIVISAAAFQTKPKYEKLLRGLISEKIKICRNYAYAMEMDALRHELDMLSDYDIERIEGAEDLDLLRLLMGLYDGKDVSIYAERYGNINDVKWLINFYEHPRGLEKEEFLTLDAAVQIFVTDKMFTSMLWKEFVMLYRDVYIQTDALIRKRFDLYYGLTLFNMQESKEASRALHMLYNEEKEECVLFYSVCADIKMHNEQYQCGRDGNAEKLCALLEQLHGFKELKQYKQQSLMVATLTMEAYYYLGVSSDNFYLARAIEIYPDYSDKIRNNKAVRFYYALCLEMNGNRTEAIEVYSSLDWKDEPVFAERYMLCCILNDQAKKAVEIYKMVPEKSIRMDSIYLLALNKSEDASYEEELRKAVDFHKDNLEALFNISYFLDSETVDKEIVVPKLKKLIMENGIGTLRQEQTIQLAVLLAHFGEIELLEILLGLVGDVKELSRLAYNEIYRGIVRVANREYIKQEKIYEKPADFKAAERIADLMLANIESGIDARHDLIRAKYLNVKVLCAGAGKLPYSSLKYSEELFSITGNVDVARNIVGLLVDRKEMDPGRYAPYIEALKDSDNPEHCMAIAAAMLLLRREDIADHYAYKALYLLNGEDDYNIYKSYFNYCNFNMRWTRQEHQLQRVGNGTVVCLVETDADGNPDRLTICLDNEPDFLQQDNRSMDVEHLTPISTDYIKVCGCGLNQIRYFRGKKYQVIQIMTRIKYGLSYVYGKVQEKPDMFKGVVWTISTEDVEDLIRQMREMDEERQKRLKSLIESYNFIGNSIGLPIDCLSMGDSDRYIDAFNYILYAKDEAFYAGQPVFGDETGQKYVLTLSTLVLLAVLDRFDLLDAIRESIMIPESYIAFLTERYEHTYTDDSESRATLFFVEGKPVLQKIDMTIQECWEKILCYCRGCRTFCVSNDERINLEITRGFSGESLITGFGLSSIHLDSLIIAKRAGATYLCDDIFFRKIASNMGVRNINTVSIVEHYEDDDTVMDFILELSKTNYIYVPLWAKNDEQAKELVNNLMDGEKKRLFYTEYIYQLQIIQEKYLRGLYGDEYVDELIDNNHDDLEND